jgi:transcription elongation factor GreA
MQEEIRYRVTVLRPKLIDDVKTAREFGDLSENFEYKAAKQEKNRNDSRVRYLERMIKNGQGHTPPIPDPTSWDSLTRRRSTLKKTTRFRKIRLVTTLRQDALNGLISKESPLGKALMGRKAGDGLKVEVNPDYSYFVVVRSVEKGDYGRRNAADQCVLGNR